MKYAFLFILTFLSHQVVLAQELAMGVPPPGTIRSMAWGEAPEEYIVQAGDSLFDICDQLLAEGNYWPKLWSLNPKIENPHFIYPGMKLKFYPGDQDSPPFLSISQEDEIIPIEKNGIEEQELIREPFTIPNDQILSSERPITEVIDASQLEVPQEFLDNLEVAGEIYTKQTESVIIPGFIYKDEQKVLGKVMLGSQGENLLSQDSALFLYNSGLSSGQMYSVLRSDGKIFHPQTGDFIGYKYLFVSHIKVEQDFANKEMAKGKVLLSRVPARQDDIVVEFKSVIRSVSTASSVSPSSTSTAHVLAFEFSDQRFGAHGSLVFLDYVNGLSSGQLLPIYQSLDGFHFGMRNKMPEQAPHIQVGVVQVLDTTDAGAVGYIVKSTQESMIGDKLSL